MLIVRVPLGLLIAAHGAQKLWGVWGLTGFEGTITQMGLRPPRLWANLSAWGEFLGGAALALDLLVAVAKVHWRNGLWITKNGWEYAGSLLLVFVVIGLVGAGDYAAELRDRARGAASAAVADRMCVAVLNARAGRTPSDPREALGMAVVFERTGESRAAADCWAIAFHDADARVRRRAALPYSRALERAGEVERATSALELALHLAGDAPLT